MAFDIIYNKEILYKDYRTHDTKVLFKKIYRSKKFNDIIADKVKTKGFNKLQFLTDIIAKNLLDNDVEIGIDKTYDNYYKYVYDKAGEYDTKPPVCVVCKKKLAVWKGRMYSRLCDSKECKDTYVKDKNVKIEAIHGTSNLASKPEHQKKMLAERGIAKEYVFKDGRVVVVMGKVEYAVVAELERIGYGYDDMKVPAPFTIKYYNPSTKEMSFHIPDIYIQKYNLIISVKDGMDNPNTHHNMKKDRLKSIYEYTSIVDDCEYSFMQVEGIPEVASLSKRLDKVKSIHDKGGRYLVPPRVDLAMLIQENDFSGMILGTPSDVLSNNTITFYALVEETTNSIITMYFNVYGSKYGNGYVIDLLNGGILFKAVDLTLVTLHSTTQLYKTDIELKDNVFDLIRMYDYSPDNEETLLDVIIDNIKDRSSVNLKEYALLKNLKEALPIDIDYIQRLFNKKMSKVFLAKNMTMLLNEMHNIENKELMHEDLPVVCLLVEGDEKSKPYLVFQIYDIYITIDMNINTLTVNPVNESYEEFLNSLADRNPKYMILSYDINRVKFMLYLLNNFISNSFNRSIVMKSLTRIHNSMSSYLVEAITHITSYSTKSTIINIEGYQEFLLEWTLILTTLEDKSFILNEDDTISNVYSKHLTFLGYNENNDK